MDHRADEFTPLTRSRARVQRWLLALVLIVLITGAVLARPAGSYRLPLWTQGRSEAEPDAAAAAEDFLRLVADSRRNEDTAPLPCVWVTNPGGLLNPCMDALTQRWAELDTIEKLGPSLTVRGVTSRTDTTALVTESNIVPRPSAPIRVTLEWVGPGPRDWKVRQLNQKALPR